MKTLVGCAVVALYAQSFPGAAAAQTAPTIDTEDATLGSNAVGEGLIHPIVSFDLRNGDYARGNYDDDRADLNSLPAHFQIGISAELHHRQDGRPDAWVVLRSSNGFHAPTRSERGPPRGWYESNNLIGLVTTPMIGLQAAVVYAIKTSPNGISNTSHEASVSLAYQARSGWGILHPAFVATVRPKGDHGIFTQAVIEPALPFSSAENAVSLSFPMAIGVGWSGFYRDGSGTCVFADVGMSLSKRFTFGAVKGSVRGEVSALIRDARLARLSGPDGETAMVVPLATIGLTFAY